MSSTMPMLTDEQREMLIDSCHHVIAEQPLSPFGAMAKIALAALTAEPVYQFIANNPDHDGYIEWADCNPDFYSKEPTDRRRILYTAPPVPALKLPDEYTREAESLTLRGYLNGFNACLAEVKALNGVTK